MNPDQLFINLSLQLGSFPEAAVLWVLLRLRADINEYKTTAKRIASDRLQSTVDPKTAQRTFRRLEAKGLISITVHRNTATLITVNREAVFDLLESGDFEGDPFLHWLPGQGDANDGEIPFLNYQTERRHARAEAMAFQTSSVPGSVAGLGAGVDMNSIPANPASEPSRLMLEQSSDYDDH